MIRRNSCLTLVVVAATLAGCEKMEFQSTEAVHQEQNPFSTQDSMPVKKVCLDGVNYYATRVVPHAGPIYWTVGGAVFTKGSATPQTCEK